MALSNPNSLEMKHLVNLPLMSFGTYEGRGDFRDPATKMIDIPAKLDEGPIKDLQDEIDKNYRHRRVIDLIEGDVVIDLLGTFNWTSKHDGQLKSLRLKLIHTFELL